MKIKCHCGKRYEVPESFVGKSARCPKCRAILRLVAGDNPFVKTPAGDFLARLIVESGPGKTGDQYLLGGPSPIIIGKGADHPIALPGVRVSRDHGRLVRTDVHSPAWQYEDLDSTNGSFVDGARTKFHVLQPGDSLRIGEYHLRYFCEQRQSDDPAAANAPPAASPHSPDASSHLRSSADAGGPVCPSCQQTLALDAKICVACGIHVKTGRPLLTAREIDEDELDTRAQNTLWFLSWIIPIGPVYPIASEAFGASKPYTIWTIAVLTFVASVLFWIAEFNATGINSSVQSLMLWPNRQPDVASILAHQSDDEAFLDKIDQIKGKNSEETSAKIVAAYNALPPEERAISEFRWYQLITHAFLHGDILHIAGNMLFLLVFGSRVNALVGNLQAAILYPLLAVAAAAAHLLFDPDRIITPMLGASGAIMGLAGMYFVLFPVHKVHMVSWIRLGFLTAFRLCYKVYALRGFWVVLFYIAFDVVATLRQSRDGVAHWAHLGGFIIGIVFALILLLSRLVNARGADILSVVLGRYAWPLLGKPCTRQGLPIHQAAALSLDCQ
jgi:membrane associated rhomboid family serine protease/pSer/pThr/pTyr-binding forkhead associated (FHA) protein